jgi:glycosyltransferase involved in cell wall biosynthesis
MIVRDEEATLARCLESAKPYVDEICVVDTGSVDRTVEIARSFGAKVRSVPWNDSFAEARNHSLDMATGNWVLVLDGDEALRAESGPLLRRIASTPDLLGALGQLVLGHLQPLHTVLVSGHVRLVVLDILLAALGLLLST